ncbi:hypothetical protein HPP92_007957 [Vanilla planifolia]|uniref:CRM-domain containing factor CFM3, chloroplastic/mitochondrial n=1 Tax=Vanilla planifolia TaxID=51239 RepID=A0A835VAJ6_VANPL|nr:hypothetical protein HPP92_007957 [Vanilla planifolia]
MAFASTVQLKQTTLLDSFHSSFSSRVFHVRRFHSSSLFKIKEGPSYACITSSTNIRKPNAQTRSTRSSTNDHAGISSVEDGTITSTWIRSWGGHSRYRFLPKRPRAAVDYRSGLSSEDDEFGTSASTGSSTMAKIIQKLKQFGYIDDSAEMVEQRLPEKGSVEDIFYAEDGVLPNARGGVSLDLSEDVRFPWELPLGGREFEAKNESLAQKKKNKTMVAELTLPEGELRRLRHLGLRSKSKTKIGGAGVTKDIVDAIQEKWKTTEIVRLKFEGLPAINMKRMHEILERKTGGLVIWRSGTSVLLYRGVSYESPKPLKNSYHSVQTTYDQSVNLARYKHNGIAADSDTRFILRDGVKSINLQDAVGKSNDLQEAIMGRTSFKIKKHKQTTYDQSVNLASYKQNGIVAYGDTQFDLHDDSVKGINLQDAVGKSDDLQEAIMGSTSLEIKKDEQKTYDQSVNLGRYKHNGIAADSDSGFDLHDDGVKSFNLQVAVGKSDDLQEAIMGRTSFEIKKDTKLPMKIKYEDEIDKLLDSIGPRYTDWPGSDPLPVDADLLPGIIPGYEPPFRILPYGVGPGISYKEATALKRLARMLPPHFALGRSRQHHGLAVAMVKLWERSCIAKVALKRGVQLTTSERIAVEIKKLTGGVILSRNKDYIVFYRGKDFLSSEVSEALVERERLAKALQDEEEQARIRASFTVLSNIEKVECTVDQGTAGTLGETLEAGARWGQRLDNEYEEKMFKAVEAARHANIVRMLEKKLSLALRKVKKAEKALAKVEQSLRPAQSKEDPESITEEERFMFRKLGLRMKAFLLLGRRGVFDGTVENMHLHWKYRELVKIIVNVRNFTQVKNIALSLEAESGGVLVSVDKISKGYAVIVFRGKDYSRPSTIRPRNLLTKRKALARSIELQRREALYRHVSVLRNRVAKLRLHLDQMEGVKDQGDDELYRKLDQAYHSEDEETEDEDNEEDDDSDVEEEDDDNDVEEEKNTKYFDDGMVDDNEVDGFEDDDDYDNDIAADDYDYSTKSLQPSGSYFI